MSTITKEFTKEQLIEKLQHRISVASGFPESEKAQMDLELARIALASLEAEHVCVIDQSNLDYLNSGSDADVWPASRAEMGDVLLYRAAPPVPVSVKIPPEKPHTDGPLADGWNACRAAMQAEPDEIGSWENGRFTPTAEPVTAATVPDGWVACSERMPEESGRYWCYVEEQNDLGKSHYQWNCSWNGDRWWVESENGGRVTHWMPLPAAPQQEVK
ncbi:DUF551 domain-containing protein [Enterobacter hormaechei subsp. steigerwaltii]|uniref:DUF551 domain-containing protein n=1 Tax=Enterobacter hormaechei TaxID=158836 RepID=UPI001FF693CE|nr:DUF551 domain-containing protein [Enterobacter hormaechei]MCK0951799.1 DUF551 domain-containing protein [Enterobacter hormaechei subsp. steigerwaltii]